MVIPMMLLGLTQASQPASSDARLITALEQFVPHALRADGAPGLTIAVGRHAAVIWRGAHASLPVT